MRRETVKIDAFGWVLIPFVADSPGLWALHCRISWHMEAGLLMQVQTRSDITTISFQNAYSYYAARARIAKVVFQYPSPQCFRRATKSSTFYVMIRPSMLFDITDLGPK